MALETTKLLIDLLVGVAQSDLTNERVLKETQRQASQAGIPTSQIFGVDAEGESHTVEELQVRQKKQ